MPDSEGSRLARLEERVEGIREDVAQLARDLRADHHRLRSVEAAVTHMADAQAEARRGEARQYRRMGNRIALAGLLVAVGMLVLSAVTLLSHYG